RLTICGFPHFHARRQRFGRYPAAGDARGERAWLSRQPSRARFDAARHGIVCLIVADVESPQTARMVRAITTRLQSVGKVAMMINISDPRDDAAEALTQTLNYRADA